MNLADKIMAERKKKGWSQEELANQLGVSRQAVSKWESAGSTPDLQRILQLSDVFGVSTDYLLKDEAESDADQEGRESIRLVTMDDVKEFLLLKEKSSTLVANATSLCILSPILLIVLSTLADENHGLSQAGAAGIGIIAILVLVSIAVYMFVSNGMYTKPMEYLEQENFRIENSVKEMIRDKRAAYMPTYSRSFSIGVVLCIVSAIPVLLAGILDGMDTMAGISVGILLAILAVGVNCMIRVSIVKGSFDTLLQEGEYSYQEKQLRKKTSAFSSVYWCLITALYLALSFWTGSWDRTWVIWPVAGVLFGAVQGLLKIFIRHI